MTKTLLFASLLSLSLAACGSVNPTGAYGDGDDTTGDDGSDTGSGSDMGSDVPDAPPAPVNPIMLEAPRAATTPAAIGLLGHSTRRKVADLILGNISADISEQRFTTVGDQPFELTFQFASPPTADVSRTISMDTNTTIIHTQVVNIQCTSGGGTVLLDDPGCNMVNAPETESATLPMTSATWSVAVIDDATMQPVTCTANGGVQSCAIPGGAGHAYRIVTSVTRISELWNGEPLTAYEGTNGYVGIPENVLFCSDSRVQNGNWYCTLDSTYRRDRGIDNASIAFGDIDVTITANGFTAMTPAKQLSWVYGEEDLPGDHY